MVCRESELGIFMGKHAKDCANVHCWELLYWEVRGRQGHFSLWSWAFQVIARQGSMAWVSKEVPHGVACSTPRFSPTVTTVTPCLHYGAEPHEPPRIKGQSGLQWGWETLSWEGVCTPDLDAKMKLLWEGPFIITVKIHWLKCSKRQK